jgi:putative Holliday junction resolvase
VEFSKRILGLDYGTKRIGVAVSDPLRVIAKGLKVVMNSPRAVGEIGAIAEEYDVQRIVVGMPFNLKGEIGSMAKEVETFMGKLKAATGREVVPWDERFTSHTAHETMRSMGVKKLRRRSKTDIDMMASALILQGYLDATRS